MDVVVGGLSAAKAAFDVSKIAVDLFRRPHVDVDAVHGKLLELQGLILSAQQALAEAHEENRRLRHALQDCHELRGLEGDVQPVQDGGFAIRKSEQAQGIFNPLCPICWGDKVKLVPLVKVGATEGNFRCALHSATYQTSAYLNKMRKQATELKLSGGGSPTGGYTPFS